jgi:uncharacterized protein
MPPTLAPGKICYIQIPALDISRSAEFYETVFGWSIRRRDDGEIAFDDSVGEVSGTWVTGRPPSAEPGVLLYVMVESVAQTLEKIAAAGGATVTPLTAQGEGGGIRNIPRPSAKRPPRRTATLSAHKPRPAASTCAGALRREAA